jgi:hypothetical protein
LNSQTQEEESNKIETKVKSVDPVEKITPEKPKETRPPVPETNGAEN